MAKGGAMKYMMLAMLPIIALAQMPMGMHQSGTERYSIGMVNLGEDTQIVMQNPKKDTVYTIDGEVMDIEPSRIAISERYYPIDEENAVAINVHGQSMSLEMIPINGTIRARLVRKDDVFVVVRIRVLKPPHR